VGKAMKFPIDYEVVDYIGIVLGIIFMVCGSIYSFFQRKKNKRELAYAESESFYNDYLQLCVEHPLSASPDQSGVEYTSEMIARHAWFVSIMLSACDKILSTSDDPVWVEVVSAQLKQHKTYLSSKEFIDSEEITWYGKELQEVYKNEFYV
jgi:hypothetical protein